ncbi:MAG: orotidine-5'-phosphate decarboxylase [Pirellulales bacterium]|nr:orotidine-5'-phosphate decarboxylase [Pirellulales bacterium]
MDQLAKRVAARGNAVCVGLDPRWEQLPWPVTIGREGGAAIASDSAAVSLPAQSHPGDDAAAYRLRAEAYLDFCCGVIDVVAPLVPVVKPQAAFFEELGPAGMTALAEVIRYAQDRGLLVILDAKRNDIGSTAEAYARGLLGRASPWGADALTVSPYLGEDSLTPFVEVARQRGAGLFILVKTSNPGSGLLQDLEAVEHAARAAEPRRIYNHVADLVEKLSTETRGQGNYGLVGAVVGATYPQQLAELRTAMPHTWFLVPGFGAQGGAAADVAPAFDAHGTGAVINNSRGIIFAHARKEYAERFGDQQWQRAIEAATLDMISQLNAAI